MPPDAAPADSERRRELADAAYEYLLEHGIGGLSLRPLARAIGSSPRVLLYLFGSKEGLVRALLERARADELRLLDGVREGAAGGGPVVVAAGAWRWLAEPRHRPLLKLWLDAYTRSLTEPDGPWSGFARTTVEDWLELLAAAQQPRRRRSAAGAAERTQLLALLRGALLDLLASDEEERVSAAVDDYLRRVESPPRRLQRIGSTGASR